MDLPDIYSLFAGAEPDAKTQAKLMADAIRRKKTEQQTQGTVSQLASLGQNNLLSGLVAPSMNMAQMAGQEARGAEAMVGDAGQFRLQQAMAAQRHRDGLVLKAKDDAAKKEKDAADDVTGLRKEFNQLPAVKQFEDVSVSFDKLKSAAADPSPAGDMAVIFGFMKMQDPGSSVREGEYASAQNAGGIDTKLRNTYNAVLDGTRLSPEQRKDFIAQAAKAYAAHESRYRQQAERYRGLAGSRADDVIKLSGRPQAVAAPATLEDVPEPVRISSEADYDKLPKGAEYIDPDGNRRTKK
jgi:hypothetical protein